MVHSHAPRLGSGMAFKTFCGITCDREGKGWEGVESRVGSGDHVRATSEALGWEVGGRSIFILFHAQ